jgi:Alpha/beta hydrolase domain
MQHLPTLGYAEEEYFLEGDALIFRMVGDGLPFDGRWDVVPGPSRPYRTRILVRRPVDPGRFNGTVVVVWHNVTAGWDFMYGETPELLEGGYAVVGVSAQRAGVHGTEAEEGLVSWDPTRYGELSIPTVDIGYDILTQAARVVGPDRPRGRSGDPMAGLDVRRLIATGPSQPANRLATYVNAVQPRESLFDGFILERYVSAAMAVSTPTGDENAILPEGSHLIRDDPGTRVLVVNPESDAYRTWYSRQPDTDWYRLWEVAGTSHVGTWSTTAWRAKYEREFGQPWDRPSHGPLQNNLSLLPVMDAAFRRMHEWITTGQPPPGQPRISIGGDPLAFERDETGVVVGGIRLPEVEVPVAIHIGSISPEEPPLRGLRGQSIPLEPAVLARLYPDHDDYVRRFAAAARAAEDAGVLLRRDVDRLILAASVADVPPG